MTHSSFIAVYNFLAVAQNIAWNYFTDLPSLSIRRRGLPIWLNSPRLSVSANILPAFE